MSNKVMENNQIQQSDYTANLVAELTELYKVHENYGITGDAYLKGDSELEVMINKILELKSSQVREQFLRNSEIIEFVTQMDYVKDMIENISKQKESLEEVAASSVQMSIAIEDITNHVQHSYDTTKEAISITTDSIETINESFTYIDRSFDEINEVQHRMVKLVEDTKEIDNVVNIINKVAAQINLLSLNASIEAARSGEAGRGFAVVAREVKKLADSTKDSAGYIRGLVQKLRGDIDQSTAEITEAVTVFSKGKEYIGQTVISMDKMEKSLGTIGATFESISANIEEQSVTTQNVTARLSEINQQTQVLNEACLKTGDGIYTISVMTENLRNIAFPYFKDFKGSQMLAPVAAEHLLWKWKAYNVVWGFAEVDENQIGNFDSCSLGRYLEVLKKQDPSANLIKTIYEPHKKVHSLSKEIIGKVNRGDKGGIDKLLNELDEATRILIAGLKSELNGHR
ncbi:methyl-accepting chemotaxis protein [Neobacillus niacini]|uniref:methyl-accepting chemotaxis protein n=1 Tax=Neobacillus niacini TaxID=86668 RepID=UPI002FFEC398